jgi:hypothetical protein
VEVWFAAAGVVIALIALVVSIVVARWQTAIQERLAAIEEARRAEEVEARSRAHMMASVIREGSRTTLVLRNPGAALARDVDIDVVSLDGHRQPPTVNGRDILPVDVQPGAVLRFGIPVSMGDAVAALVTDSWTDEVGGHKEPFAVQLF